MPRAGSMHIEKKFLQTKKMIVIKKFKLLIAKQLNVLITIIFHFFII
jgi:hypothetical protein